MLLRILDGGKYRSLGADCGSRVMARLAAGGGVGAVADGGKGGGGGEAARRASEYDFGAEGAGRRRPVPRTPKEQTSPVGRPAPGPACRAPGARGAERAVPGRPFGPGPTPHGHPCQRTDTAL